MIKFSVKLRLISLACLVSFFSSTAFCGDFKGGVYSTGLANSTGEIRVDSKLNISVVVNRPFKDEFCRFYGKCSLKDNYLECVSLNYKKFPLSIDVSDPQKIIIDGKLKNNQIVKNIACEQGVTLFGEYQKVKSEDTKTEVSTSGIIYSHSSDKNNEDTVLSSSGDILQSDNGTKLSTGDIIHSDSKDSAPKTGSSSRIGELLKSCRQGNDLDCETVGSLLEQSLSKK